MTTGETSKHIELKTGDIYDTVEEVQETQEIAEPEEIARVEETPTTERIYYSINEQTAKTAKEINSFSDYENGSATREYRYYCDKAYDILDKIKELKPEQAESATNKVDYYCRKLAKYFNDYYKNEASCPSVMISGPANFPVKKKNRQNSRRETLHNTWEYLQDYIRKIENILTCDQPIKSSDANAIEQLKNKIEQLEAEHKMHLACNRYYKKHGTLKGFDGLDPSDADKIEEFVKRNPLAQPFITYNETANIRRYKERLDNLIKEKQGGFTEQIETDDENELYKVVENKDIMRLQILFDGVPNASVREILKKNGFRWSPKNKAWQRQLTNNARLAYQRIKDELKNAMVV